MTAQTVLSLDVENDEEAARRVYDAHFGASALDDDHGL